MRYLRTTAAIVAAASVLLASGGGLAAAAVDNDSYAGRVAIGSVPFTATVDTSTATTDDDDTDINQTCGAPATEASVWYEYTAPADGAVLIDVIKSNYSAGVLVGTGGPGNWTIETCGPGAVALPTAAGQTYAILIIDFQGDGGGNGGTLQLEMTEAPPPPIVDVTVNPTGIYDVHTGSATISGTVTCTGGPSLFSLIQTEVRQKRGRYTVIGFGFTDVTCDATQRQWSIEVLSPNGPFGQGEALDVTVAIACGVGFCSQDFEERQVRLRNH